jgi:hypothetical protein
MATIFTKTDQHFPAPAQAPANNFAYGDALKDDDIIKPTVSVTLAAHSVKLGQLQYVLKLALECKASAFEGAKDKTKIIDSIVDEQQLKFQLIHSDNEIASERVVTFSQLKSLKDGDWYQNELALRSASRFAHCIASADFSADQTDNSLKLTFITGDKKYGPRTIVSIAKPVPKQVVLVEINNLPRNK